MSFMNFVEAHVEDIRNYVQPAIHWREGRFATPVARAENVGGDFSSVMGTLPATLTRDDVVSCFRDDLYRGFVATILWGGLSRFRPEEISRRNTREVSIPKLERLRQLLLESQNDSTIINDAIASMRRGEENYFYGIGPSYFTKLLYFLSYDMDLETRPLIYDENLKYSHFALMPECGENPFFYYIPMEPKMSYAELCDFPDVYIPYCNTLCETARNLGVDVTNFESWLFGWPLKIHKPQPNPRKVARREVERMKMSGFITVVYKINNLYDSICASRVFVDNGFEGFVHFFDSKNKKGKNQDNPIIINEIDNYVHLEYVVAEAFFNFEGLSFSSLGQTMVESNGKYIDLLRFNVWQAGKDQDDEKASGKDCEIYFDITAGYNHSAIAPW